MINRNAIVDRAWLVATAVLIVLWSISTCLDLFA
jgi:hypothetical protein